MRAGALLLCAPLLAQNLLQDRSLATVGQAGSPWTVTLREGGRTEPAQAAGGTAEPLRLIRQAPAPHIPPWFVNVHDGAEHMSCRERMGPVSCDLVSMTRLPRRHLPDGRWELPLSRDRFGGMLPAWLPAAVASVQLTDPPGEWTLTATALVTGKSTHHTLRVVE